MPNHKNIPPDRSSKHESPVSRRFSFATVGQLRQDVIVGDGVRSKRVLSYSTPRAEAVAVRDALDNQGLLLGRRVSNEDSGFDHFMIPHSARPIAHDSTGESKNNLAYTDDALFFDLGNLLGNVAKQGAESPLVLDNIGDNVAIIEFTRVGEPKISLVPGFEWGLQTVTDDDSALFVYGEYLSEEFGAQYDRNAEFFIEGFRAALS